jgi:hypothetical protein
MLITFPNVLAIDEVVAGNPIRQIGERRLQLEGVLANFTRGVFMGFFSNRRLRVGKCLCFTMLGTRQQGTRKFSRQC